MNELLELEVVEGAYVDFLRHSQMRRGVRFCHGLLASSLIIAGGSLVFTSSLTANGLGQTVIFGFVLLLGSSGYWIHMRILTNRAKNRFIIECPNCGCRYGGRELLTLAHTGICGGCKARVVCGSFDKRVSWGEYYSALLRKASVNGSAVLLIDRGVWVRGCWEYCSFRS